MNLISIVIPAFNEALRLPPTLDEILNYVRNPKQYRHARLINELVVVDDASRDGTLEWVEMYRPKFEEVGVSVNAVQHFENRGKWAAIRTGINASKHDQILLMDADGSAGIRNLEKLKYIGYPTFGSRFSETSNVEGKSFIRTMVSHGYRQYALTMYSYASGRKDVEDLQCPFKLFRKSDMRDNLTSERYAGDIELALSMKPQIKNLGVDFLHMRGSKVKLQDIFEMAKQTYAIAKSHRRVYFQRAK